MYLQSVQNAHMYVIAECCCYCLCLPSSFFFQHQKHTPSEDDRDNNEDGHNGYPHFAGVSGSTEGGWGQRGDGGIGEGSTAVGQK